jgi:hypothetical protein
LYYKLKEAYKPIRFCGIRKTEEAEMKGIERLKEMNRMKSHGKPPSEAQLANNRYVIVITSLLETEACLILQLYRFRRQIEPVFKRLRTCSPQSLFGYNQIPSKVDISAKAQVYGKLLLAAFCETWANKARFSPCADRSIRWDRKRKHPLESVAGTAGYAHHSSLRAVSFVPSHVFTSYVPAASFCVR